MRLKRFIAEDTRTALQLVRAEQGADAVILSNRTTPAGIEIISATEFDEALFHSISPKRPRTENPDVHSADGRDETGETRDATDRADVPEGGGPEFPGGELASIHAGIDALKGLLEGQLSKLAWDANSRRHPNFTGHLKQLNRLGFEPSVARRLAVQLAPAGRATDSTDRLRGLLSASIEFGGQELVNDGGIAALIGATGVGKTTTIAKLAARAALIHGRSRVALISADANRIGAHDQLSRLAALLGIDMFEAAGRDDIEQLLSHLDDRHLVLIDTAGISQGDSMLGPALRELSSVSQPIRLLLTIAANSQFRCIDWTIRSYAAANAGGIILTKIDETSHLAPAISAMLNYPLGVEFVTDGQVIPDDLHLAADRRDWLIDRCLNPMSEATPEVDEDFLAQTFAGGNHVCI